MSAVDVLFVIGVGGAAWFVIAGFRAMAEAFSPRRRLIGEDDERESQWLQD